MKKYKIRINRDLCIGSASCVAFAERTFGLDEECKAILLNSDGNSLEEIEAAAASCPTGAILVEERE